MQMHGRFEIKKNQFRTAKLCVRVDCNIIEHQDLLFVFSKAARRTVIAHAMTSQS